MMNLSAPGPVLILTNNKAASELLADALSNRNYKRRDEFFIEFKEANSGTEMVLACVGGHLMQLQFMDEPWSAVKHDNCYYFTTDTHYVETEENSSDLKEEVKRCKELVLWFDDDSEGEMLAFEAAKACLTAKPGLTIKRARFNVEPFSRPSDNLFESYTIDRSNAFTLRREINFRMAKCFTSFQTNILKNKYAYDASDADIMFDPCQFATLGLIVQRQWEIESHKQQKFWNISSDSSKELETNFNWSRGSLYDERCVSSIYTRCKSTIAKVTKATSGVQKKIDPPRPLNTSELLKRASRILNMKPEETMKIAEDLYTSGYISNPRTNTDCFVKEVPHLQSYIMCQSLMSLGSHALKLFEHWRGKDPSGGKHDDKEHYPIIALRHADKLDETHQRLYDLVARHFLACLSPPAFVTETRVEIEIAGEIFSAVSRTISEKGFMEFYNYDYESWGESQIGNYTVGDEFTPTLEICVGRTAPPLYLSESEIIGCMDKEHIGSEATKHLLIKQLMDNKYVEESMDSNIARFKPTDLDNALVMGYANMGLDVWKPQFCKLLEYDVKAVLGRSKTKDHLLKTCMKQMNAQFKNAMANEEKFCEAIGIFFRRKTNEGTGTSTSGTLTSGNGYRNNQQTICISCNQMGHSSVDCYSLVPQNHRFMHNGGSTPFCPACKKSRLLKTSLTRANYKRHFYTCGSLDCNLKGCWLD